MNTSLFFASENFDLYHEEMFARSSLYVILIYLCSYHLIQPEHITLNNIITAVLLAIPCFFPAGLRIINSGIQHHAGLLSDLGFGMLLYAIVLNSPRWLRALLLLLWTLTQAMSQELLAAMQRLPSWQDIQYLLDPTFVKNTTAGLHLALPVFVVSSIILTIIAIIVPAKRVGWKMMVCCIFTGLLLLGLHHPISKAASSQSIAERYNPMHWLLTDSLSSSRSIAKSGFSQADLPVSLRTLDLSGTRLIEKGKAKNVLIVTLEGISGIYLPEIREKMLVPETIFQMRKFAESTKDGMLVADLVTHSHQTIRGLYSLHCGDFSKFSYEMPKATELQSNPERAAECLPAQMDQQGWETHYLQGAGLQFMNKERAMPTMGFQNVHGVEWFTERTSTDFIWGTTDADFFHGARKYIKNLQAEQKPWLLSLLTVATHQPFTATEEMAKKYGSRKIATVAQLDDAVSRFVEGLREDGVLEDTLVIFTSDESHGADGAGWYSSWGYAIVLAPEKEKLPRQKEGTYGLVDIETTILDYLNLPMPPSIIGRSMFRDYSTPRDMVSYTSSKLRWQTADNYLFECGRDGNCEKMENARIIGLRPETITEDTENSADKLFALATVIDNKLQEKGKQQVLQFADGEIRKLPEKIVNEWTNNLIGAQYLAFPENSRVHVNIRLKAISAPPAGIQMKLTLRQFEQEVKSIEYPPLPLLHTGEECQIQFDFDNIKSRQGFSFHLVGEGPDSSIQFQKFEITINPQPG
jgi:hypothetical protein